MIMKKSLLILCLLGGMLQVMAKKTDHSHDYYMEWAERIANSEMQHNEHLWMADFRKKPKWDYTQGLVAKSMLELYKNTDAIWTMWPTLPISSLTRPAPS